MKKTALITGASRGIGKAIAEAMAAEGYHLYLVCRNNLERMQDNAGKMCEKYSISCRCYSGDISDVHFVESIFQSMDSLDVLINCAGIAHIGLLHEMTPEQWHNVMGINTDSIFYTSKCAIPLMLKKQSGCIINISSVWGISGASMEVAYSASKGAVNAFTKALGKELAPSHIRVNAIACGLIDTDMNNQLSGDEMQAVIQGIPADRIGDPKEVAKLALQLCDAPEYLTGQIITLDGGWI